MSYKFEHTGIPLDTSTYTFEPASCFLQAPRVGKGNGQKLGGSPPGVYPGYKTRTCSGLRPIFKRMTMQFHLGGLPETNRFGHELAHAVGDGAIIALRGTLGAGKTTLVKAVGKGLGVVEVISSPTFTMLNEYHSGRLSLFHLDLYRAGETGETIDLSMLALELDEVLDEVLDDLNVGSASGIGSGVANGLGNDVGVPSALVMIEWPQYFLVDGESYLADKDYLEISLDLVKQENVLHVVMGSQEGATEKVLQETYEAENPIKDGVGEARIANLVGHGPQSSRVIGRLQSALPDMVI